jgi:hypothetical protein
MPLRQALNAVYAALCEGTDDLDTLDRELEAAPAPSGARGRVRPIGGSPMIRPTGTTGDLMAAMGGGRPPR